MFFYDLDIYFCRLFAKALQCPSQTNNESGPSMVASMKESEKTPLASLYGAVQGLAELGPEVIKVNFMIFREFFLISL